MISTYCKKIVGVNILKQLPLVSAQLCVTGNSQSVAASALSNIKIFIVCQRHRDKARWKDLASHKNQYITSGASHCTGSNRVKRK